MLITKMTKPIIYRHKTKKNGGQPVLVADRFFASIFLRFLHDIPYSFSWTKALMRTSTPVALHITLKS